MQLYGEEVLKTLLADSYNGRCCDCGTLLALTLLGQEEPHWVSINNGVFLGDNCARIHRTLGILTSFIRSIPKDSWTDRQLEYLRIGGNKRFADFMQSYDLNAVSPLIKYRTKAAEFYRQSVLVRSLHPLSLRHRSKEW